MRFSHLDSPGFSTNIHCRGAPSGGAAAPGASLIKVSFIRVLFRLLLIVKNPYKNKNNRMSTEPRIPYFWQIGETKLFFINIGIHSINGEKGPGYRPTGRRWKEGFVEVEDIQTPVEFFCCCNSAGTCGALPTRNNLMRKNDSFYF
jgi:hypothetical protein